MDIFEQLERVKGQMEYSQMVLSQGGLTKWEEKEHLSLIKDDKIEIARLKKCINEYNKLYGGN